MPQIRADLIKAALAKRHVRDVFLTEVKTGPTWSGGGTLFRMDAIAIKRSWSKPCITGYEVKVSRADFVQDDKWPGYRDYCHRLYFACPAGLIKAEELSDDVGLITYNPETGGLYTAKAALFRDIELPWTMFYHLVISHLDSDHRHPFFSHERELIEAWVEDKAERTKLDARFKGKMAQTVREAEERMAEADHRAERTKVKADAFDRLVALLKPYGIHPHPDTTWWEHDLARRLEAGVSELQIDYIRRELTDALKCLDKLKPPTNGEAIA